MRNARSPYSPARRLWIAALAGGLCVCGAGCHQHYYYYGPPGTVAGCPPAMISPSAVVEGPICEVPSAVDGGTVVNSRSTIIDDGGGRSRVVVSQPSGGARSSSSRFGWRSYNPEDVPAITRVEGALDSSVK